MKRVTTINCTTSPLFFFWILIFSCCCAFGFLVEAALKTDDTPDGSLLRAKTVAQLQSALDMGADINVQDDTSGQTPLMAATLQGKYELVQYLLNMGADTTIGEKDGYTPPHGAGFQGRFKIMELLVQHGLDVNEPHDVDRYMPLHRACWGRESRHTETVKFLLEHGIPADLRGGTEQKNCLEMTKNPETRDLLLRYISNEL